MAFNTERKTLGEDVVLRLHIGSRLLFDAPAGATSLTPNDITMFDPNGGTLMTLDGNVITYTGIASGALSGIPSSGTGSISAELKHFDDADADIVMAATQVTPTEIDNSLVKHARHNNGLYADFDNDQKVIHFGVRYLDSLAELRTSDGDVYDVLTPDTSDYLNARFTFNTKQTSEYLYLFGTSYNVPYTIADLLMRFSADDRIYRFIQTGQTSKTKPDLNSIAQSFRAEGAALNF